MGLGVDGPSFERSAQWHSRQVAIGRKVVGPTGLPVALVADRPTVSPDDSRPFPFYHVLITALPTNGARVAVGLNENGQPSATAGSEAGVLLAAGEQLALDVVDPSEVLVAGASGDGVSFTVLTP